jgi:hypothetical protein
MRFLIAVALGAVLLTAPVGGQAVSGGDDAVIDSLLTQKVLSWSNAAWLVGRASGTLPDGTNPDQATPRGRSGTAPIDLQSYSELLVSGFQIPTGLLYGLFPGPRYALRELVYRKIVPPALAPDSALSGEEAMRYLQATQDWKEAHP